MGAREWKARPRKPSEKDRRDRGPPPEQWKCQGGVPSPLPSDLCTVQLLFQLLCWTESLRQCPLHRCWWTTWTTRSKRRPTCSAQLHLPTHDLFWANVRVQLHLPPLRSLDLAWNPVQQKWWSAWYNRYRWLGLKHQITYLPTRFQWFKGFKIPCGFMSYLENEFCEIEIECVIARLSHKVSLWCLVANLLLQSFA